MDLYVGDQNAVKVISDSSNSVIKTIPVGKNPIGVIYDPSNNMIYVANDDNASVSVLSAATDSVIATIKMILRRWRKLSLEPWVRF